MKQDITLIDKNFLLGSSFEAAGLKWYSVHDEPIQLRGLAVHKGNDFNRLPLELLPACSDGVKSLSWHTAGGRVRFQTDSPRIALRCESRFGGFMSHMPITGSAGIDAYVNGVFRAAIRPGNGNGGFFEGEFRTRTESAQIELNLPLYNGITQLYIGVEEGAQVCAPRPYAIDTPVVYYGSSITQGGCASRPGNSYQGHITRWLDCDHINLGFSGNAKGEDSMAEYIATLRMSAFVYDYDHNAPTPEHLSNTHSRFFSCIRRAQPELPVIFISRPDCEANPAETPLRREIIKATYDSAVEQGDKKVWFIDGFDLFGSKDRDACTVDGSHPNDLGFYRMAQTILPVLKQALSIR